MIPDVARGLRSRDDQGGPLNPTPPHRRNWNLSPVSVCPSETVGRVYNIESRFKAAVFADGGLDNRKILSEVNPLNFAPRVKIPVLMINGRYDFVIPFETCQQPLFRLLGTPPTEKRQVVLESGHDLPLTPLFKETLNWLDHYLGPVK